EGRPRATISALFMFTCRGILGYYSPLNTTNSKTIITNKNYNTHSCFLSLHSKNTQTTSFKSFSSLKDENETNSSPVSIAPEKQDNISNNNDDNDDVGRETNDEDNEKQEIDWKTDEEFKKFMGNPSIEAAIKLEKKRTDRKLKELDIE
ncbi:peptidase M50 family protein, partial [Trifolium medium]|nr:peptidase M50 family protein [Trifolium medium]